MSEAYPNLSMGPETWGCYDPVAGVLMADKALKTVWQTFQKEGGQILDNSPVKKIIPDSESSTRVILSDDRTIVTRYLVVCAGPWTNRLLDPLGWKLPLQPIKIPVFYFKADGHIPHTFIFEDEDRASHIWGLPELEYPGLVKVFIDIVNSLNRVSPIFKMSRFACIPVPILTLNNGTLLTSLPIRKNCEISFPQSFPKWNLHRPLKNLAFTLCLPMEYIF